MEKMNVSDLCAYFSIDDENGSRDEYSYSIVQLNEFMKEEVE